MTNFSFSKTDPKILLAVALFGLFMVAFPVFVLVKSDFINAVSVFAPIVGILAWVWLIVIRFGRGFLSNVALMIVSPVVYIALLIAMIIIPMATI